MAAAAIDAGAGDRPSERRTPPTACPRCAPGDDLVGPRCSRSTDARRRRRRRGDQQGRQQGRGPGPRRRPARTPWPTRPSGSWPGAGRPRSSRTRHGLTHGGGRASTPPTSQPRPRRAAARGPGRLRPRACAHGSASAPGATSPSSSPTPPAGRGARARPTSRSAPPGCASLEDYAGRVDAHGNELAVTAPAVADEIAGAAELAQGKLGGRPFAVVRGRADLVLPPGDDGPGAAALVRPDGADMFGYGAREAVRRAPCAATPPTSAAVRAPGARRRAGAALGRCLGTAVAARDGDGLTVAAPAAAPACGRRCRVRPRLGRSTTGTRTGRRGSGCDQPLRRLCPRSRPSASHPPHHRGT